MLAKKKSKQLLKIQIARLNCFWKLPAALLFSLLLAIIPAYSQQQATREAKIKAALVYYLAKFVVWPQNDSSSINVCSIVSEDMQLALHEVLTSKEVNKRPIQVVKLSKYNEALGNKACQILFLDANSANSIGVDLPGLQKRSILTTCESEQISWGKCVVQIIAENNKARLAIDTNLAQEAQLKVSSELLELAIVRP